jgi:hypothetical protein
LRFFGIGYKYRGIGDTDSKERSRLREIIVENKCYFPKPSSLNDPFDCNPVVGFNDPAELRKYIQKKYRREFNHKASSEEITKTIIDMKNEYSDYSMREIFDDYIGVFCLSECNNLNLMWSHYADSHKGVCLGFDLDIIKSWFCKKVGYSDQRININLIKLKNNDNYQKDILSKSVFTKGEDWLVEKEVRCLSKYSGHQGFTPEGLVSITFGLATSLEDRNFILDLVEESGSKLAIEECWQTDAEHSLRIRMKSSNKAIHPTSG